MARRGSRAPEPIPCRPRPAAMLDRPIRILAACALALVAVTAGPVARTLACSCAVLAGPEEALANADVAFVGVVARSEDPTGGPLIGSGDPIIYTFAVEEPLKGDTVAGGAVLVRSARDGASCGMSFALAQRWRIYAYVAEGSLSTGLCSGNELLAEQAPIPQLTDDPDAPPPTELLLAAAAVVLVALVSGLAFLGGRRTPADRG